MSLEINELLVAQIDAEREIINLTSQKFPKHLALISSQHNALSEFLANCYEYDYLKQEDSNQFILCFSLLADSLRKERICVYLIQRGYYSEAAELVRNIMQSCFQIIYISKNKDKWRDWFKQQDYEEKKLFGHAENPRTIFANFKELLISIGEEENYPVFQKLCAWSHPSIESMRSVFQLDLKQKNHKYFVTTKYDEQSAEFLLNFLFGFINRCIWDGFKDTFVLIDKTPNNLNAYKLIQDEVSKVFDKFYLDS